MNTFSKIICAFASLSLLAACDRFENNTPIYTEFDFPRCQMPAGLSIGVEGKEVTLNLNVFPDAEKYELKIYDAPFPADGSDPAPESAVQSEQFSVSDLPYTFSVQNEQDYYFCIRTLNTKTGKEPSKWKKGSFSTVVTP